MTNLRGSHHQCCMQYHEMVQVQIQTHRLVAGGVYQGYVGGLEKSDTVHKLDPLSLMGEKGECGNEEKWGCEGVGVWKSGVVEKWECGKVRVGEG